MWPLTRSWVYHPLTVSQFSYDWAVSRRDIVLCTVCCFLFYTRGLKNQKDNLWTHGCRMSTTVLRCLNTLSLTLACYLFSGQSYIILSLKTAWKATCLCHPCVNPSLHQDKRLVELVLSWICCLFAQLAFVFNYILQMYSRSNHYFLLLTSVQNDWL